ncbi:1-hydroxycarotenoid 3,4-desaturase CrtD [Roseivirga sp. BDSF3-8]|uniref:1-hydroxycarotenoid 3,4-desaturase CrtD n=1 Tax=Roseivirga sp. BDSF3-8 TaxID=3241598 RepID=UPI003531E924
MKLKKKVAIVGAGIAGIAASVRLARAGNEVTVYEANDGPGGKLRAFNCAGYRFDAGPSLFTMPMLVDELFILCDENPEDHFTYRQLPVTCHYFFEDGLNIYAYTDRQKLLQELQGKVKDDPAAVIQALDKSQKLYSMLGDLFMKRSLHRASTFLNKEALHAYTRLHKMDFFRTMHEANASRFTDPHLVQLFDRYATYNGSDPYKTPATMNIIPHLEFNIGTYFPEGGMYSITESLFKLAKRQGVQFRFDTPVHSISVTNGKVSGLETKAGGEHYDTVVSNMDVVNTYRKLLPDQKHPEKLLRQPKSSSAIIFYWGIRRKFDELDLHNILFSQDYKAEFHNLFDKKTLYKDPTIYVNITSKYQQDDAPEGCENWFVMINAPHNDGQNWDKLIDQARNSIQEKLKRMLGQNIASLIACEEVLDPRTIELKTSSSQGALYGNSSNNRYAAFLRHANFSKNIKGLYFCGGSVHPGGGIPLCLNSARLAAEAVERDS